MEEFRFPFPGRELADKELNYDPCYGKIPARIYGIFFKFPNLRPRLPDLKVRQEFLRQDSCFYP